jgi:hypothetical protein
MKESNFTILAFLSKTPDLPILERGIYISYMPKNLTTQI